MTITSENQSYLSPRNTQKIQIKYDSESVIKDFRGLSRISRATTKSERRWVSFLNPTYNSRITWKDSTPFFPQKKPKKACNLLHFCIIILFKEKTISHHLISPFKRSLMRKKLQCVTRRRGNFLYISRQSVFAVLYRLYNHCYTT